MDNKDNILELKRLLERKYKLFLEVERITDEMNESHIDKITELLEIRGETLEKVIELNNQIKSIIAQDESLRSVINCDCEMNSLKGELKELFEESLRVRAIVNRIIKNEDDIRFKIESERESLLNRIETMNASSTSVADSYRRSVKTGLPQEFSNNKDKTI